MLKLNAHPSKVVYQSIISIVSGIMGSMGFSPKISPSIILSKMSASYTFPGASQYFISGMKGITKIMSIWA